MAKLLDMVEAISQQVFYADDGRGHSVRTVVEVRKPNIVKDRQRRWGLAPSIMAPDAFPSRPGLCNQSIVAILDYVGPRTNRKIILGTELDAECDALQVIEAGGRGSWMDCDGPWDRKRLRYRLLS